MALEVFKSQRLGVRQRKFGSICNLLFLSCPRFHRLERKERREHRERSGVRREGIWNLTEEKSMSGQHHKAMCQGPHCSLINCSAETMPGYNHSAVQTLEFLGTWTRWIIKNHLELSHGITVEIPIAIRFTLYYWKIIALQYCVSFCHISTWISYRYTYVPSLLNPLPSASSFHHSRLSRSNGLSSLCHIANFHLLSILHMLVCMFPCSSLNLSHPLFPPLCP